MSKTLTLLFLFFLSITVSAKPITTIKGFTNDYVGKEVKIFIIEDYLSQLKTQVASGIVGPDSTFKISFYNTITRKLRLEVDGNYFHIYSQPGSDYQLFIEANSPYMDERAKSVELEFFFLELDTSDINYKILMFENEQFNFLQANYNPRSIKTTEFVTQLDTFKVNITKKHERDTSQYFKAYVKYSIASIDDLAFMGQRNEYEKFDFYIKPETVLYHNDRYMAYILHYYKLYERQISNSVNERFYEAVIKSSPSLAMNALGGDYSLKNLRLRELIMLKMLSEVFYTNDYPQTNILTMMDSVSNHALFEENKAISSNLKYRLLDLVPGTKAPEFSLMVNGERKYKNDYKGKHVYIQFISKDIKRSINDLPLLYTLQQRYSKNTQFVTILVVENDDPLLDDPSLFIKENKIAWDFSVIKKNDPLIKQLIVSTFPNYLLMDADGFIIAAPALSPRPNNEYETIENTLILIDRKYRQMEERNR